MNSVIQYLESLGANPVEMKKSELIRSIDQWLHTFCQSVYKKTGKLVYNGYKWHAFSFNYTQSVTGYKAIEIYLNQPLLKYIVFNEDESWGYWCSGGRHPQFDDDVYVADIDHSWSMVYTHEQPSIGPYFVSGRDA